MTTSRAPTKPPGPVLGAFWILMISAALRTVIAVITLIDWQNFVDAQLRGPLPAHTTVAQARTAIHTFLAVNVALDLLFAALYVLCAYQIKAAKNWARIALTVVIVAFALFNVIGGTDIITVISILVELLAVLLLYMPTAKKFFARPEPA
ncbi:MAG TPA: hypothetical protein VFX16_17420 [Pseudonocardiaceae bacterium]|nr:hypothetical protein [Pseudonocardiaceae bacterium]